MRQIVFTSPPTRTTARAPRHARASRIGVQAGAPNAISSLAAAASADYKTPKERWQCHAALRAHVQDVLDLAWSSDATTLVSASVDNAVMIWQVNNPTATPVMLRQHANFVQGVSIDPLNRLVACMGNDRALLVFCESSNSWNQIATEKSILRTTFLQKLLEHRSGTKL